MEKKLKFEITDEIGRAQYFRSFSLRSEVFASKTPPLNSPLGKGGHRGVAKKSAQIQCPASSCFNYGILIFLFAIFILLPITSDAAYKIYLKNGSEIKGVSNYEKSGGEIRFYFRGGMVGIPEADILKIESSEEPAEEIKAPEEKQKPMEPEVRGEMPGFERAEETPELKKQPDEKADEIAQKEAELKKTEEDLKRTMVRIQNLWDKSLKGTITSEERSMLQQNMVKKRKLEDDKKRLEDELKALREKRSN